MTFNIKIIQLSLVSIGVILILITYFLYPQIKKEEKISVVESDKLIEENEVVLDGKKGSLFENVEYKGFYNIDNSLVVIHGIKDRKEKDKWMIDWFEETKFILELNNFVALASEYRNLMKNKISL